jgi:hypothetical protein
VAKISYQDVIDAVVLRLRVIFPQANIFTNEVPQELNPAAFYVRLLPVKETQETGIWYANSTGPALGARFRREVTVEVTYFPEDEQTPNEELYRVQEVLFRALRMLQTPGGDYLGARNPEATSSDGVLVYVASYPHFVREDQPTQTMDSITMERTTTRQEEPNDKAT